MSSQGGISRVVHFTLTPFMRQQLYRRLHQAYAGGTLQLVKRIHTLLAMADGMTVCEVAQMLNIGEQTVQDYLNRFLWQGVTSFGLPASARTPPAN